VGVNAYFASVAADFIRNKLIECSKSFTFETEMSFPDKVELLRKAQTRGYCTYIFDNSTHEHIWLAEITDGQVLEIKTDQVPEWFRNALGSKFNIENKG
jgi:predicted ABC-type ATPase